MWPQRHEPSVISKAGHGVGQPREGGAGAPSELGFGILGSSFKEPRKCEPEKHGGGVSLIS